MRKSIIACALLCLCVCLTACGEQQDPPQPSSDSLGDEPVIEETLNIDEPTGEELNTASLSQSLHVSDTPYALPTGNNEPDSGGVDEDLLIYTEKAYYVGILIDILGDDIVVGYGENTHKKKDMKELVQAPELYHMIHYL